MARVTIAAPVAPARTATDAAAEQLLRGVVAALVPHLHAQIGAIQHQTGDQAGTTWTTEGWLADGTWVWLAVPVGGGEVCWISTPRRR